MGNEDEKLDVEGQEQADEAKPQPRQEQPEEDVRDSHGQPGINRERHDREMAAKDAEIAELKARLDEAAKSEQGRKDLADKIAALEKSQQDERVTHKLELAGCVNTKAAKALLEDYEGDVEKLKAECPYLFGEKKRGSTGLKPESAAGGDVDAKLDKAFGLK